MNWEKLAKGIGLLLAVGSLAFTLVQFAVSNAIDAEKPYLEKKLAWCEEPVRAASEIAVHADPVPDDLIKKFMALHWGVMGMVEGERITSAMWEYRSLLNSTGKGDTGKAIEIAKACRHELSADWSPIWRR